MNSPIARRRSTGLLCLAFATAGACLAPALQPEKTVATQTVVFRTNSGGPLIKEKPAFWTADNQFAGGNTYAVTTSIANTPSPQIYQTERWGNFSYSIAVPNGSYVLRLHFAEIYFQAPGQRKFNVRAENNQVLSNYDIVADAGSANRAVIKSFPVTVADGRLDIQFQSVVNNAKVSAIEILTAEVVPPPPEPLPPPPEPLPPPPPPPPASEFSDSLAPYLEHPSARSKSVDEILAATTTPGAFLSAAEQQVRRSVVSMYKDFGIDLSLDSANARSEMLVGLSPVSWSPQTPQPLAGNYLQPFSIDAPFYHLIPSSSPRVPLPTGYFQSFQYNTVQGFDGIGIGIAISDASHPVRRIRSEWYGNINTRQDYYLRVRPDALAFQGWNQNSDRALSFIDASTNTHLNGYFVTQDSNGVDFNALFAGGVHPLGSLGDRGGSTASGISQIGPLIRPGEATNPDTPIPHAVGGPVRRVWKARSYPASGWDHFINDGDPCSGGATGKVNTGLAPYGAVLQLDPTISFTKLSGQNRYTATVGGQTLTISLPAFRVLEAMQRFGYYVMDYGCSDLDVYTNTNDSEYASHGGAYNVQRDIESVVKRATFFVVPPRVKKQ